MSQTLYRIIRLLKRWNSSMSLRIRLNIIITTLLLILFLCSSFYTITNAKRSVRSEVESSTQLALQLIQAASASTALDAGDQKLNFLRKLAELKTIRHLHIELRSPTDILYQLMRIVYLRKAELLGGLLILFGHQQLKFADGSTRLLQSRLMY